MIIIRKLFSRDSGDECQILRDELHVCHAITPALATGIYEILSLDTGKSKRATHYDKRRTAREQAIKSLIAEIKPEKKGAKLSPEQDQKRADLQKLLEISAKIRGTIPVLRLPDGTLVEFHAGDRKIEDLPCKDGSILIGWHVLRGPYSPYIPRDEDVPDHLDDHGDAYDYFCEHVGEMIASGDSRVQITDEFLLPEPRPEPIPEPSDEDVLAQIRSERDRLLSSSDWTQMPDVKWDKREAWAKYRQKLRDITKQADLRNVTWPTPPKSS